VAFVSINEMTVRNGPNQCPRRTPAVTVRRNGIGHITIAVFEGPKQPTIEFQVDAELKKVRLKTGGDFKRKLNGQVGMTFAVPKKAREQILGEGEPVKKMLLTKADDGWWYGNYGVVSGGSHGA